MINEFISGQQKEDTRPITERVTDLESACLATGRDYNAIMAMSDRYKLSEKALETFAEAMREGKDPAECWYYPYFDRSGGGFSYFDFDLDCVFSFVGARLRVPTPETAEHMGKCMLKYYKYYINHA